MDSRILTDDLEGAKQELFHTDADGSITIEQVQDCTEIIEHNRAMYNLSDGIPHFGDGKCVASIPIVIWMELQRQGITEDPAAMRRWLNDPDNRAFRLLPGRV